MADSQLLVQDPDDPAIFGAMSDLVADGRFSQLRVAVAFATAPGVLLLKELLQIGKLNARVVVGLDNSITEPRALTQLFRDDRVTLRVFTSPAGSMFHAKSYYFRSRKEAALIVGSCNLSAAALTKNRECAVQMTGKRDWLLFQDWEAWWQALWSEAEPCSRAIISAYLTCPPKTDPIIIAVPPELAA